METGDLASHYEIYHGDPPDVREARRIVAEYDCMMHGHDWTVVQTVQRPTFVICERCGESYPVGDK